MTVACIFDRQWMQIELGLHLLQRAGVRLQQCDPDETTGLDQVPMDVLRLDVRELPPVLIHNAADQHGVNCYTIFRAATQKLTARSQGRRIQCRQRHHSLENVVEAKVFIATAALVMVTWLLYKLAEWLEPRK